MSRAIQAQDSGMILGTLPSEQVADLRRLARHAAERALALDSGAALGYAALAALEPVAGAFWPDVEYAALSPIYTAAYTAAFLRDCPRVELLRTDILTNGPDTPYVRNAIIRLDEARARPGEAIQQRLGVLRKSLAKTGTVSLYIASDVCDPGHPDEALELLEQASFDHLVQPGGRLLPGDFGIHGLFRGLFAAIHERRRFVALCSRVGLCDYWVTSDRWPDCAERLSK